MNFHIGIISHKRPHNVQKMQELVGKEVVWYVGQGEVGDYIDAGAKGAVNAGGLIEARNLILADAFKQNKIAVMLDDDLKKIEMGGEYNGKKIALEITFKEALQYIYQSLQASPFHLAGTAPTPNLFYCEPKKPFSYTHFIGGWFMMIRPHEQPLHFDSTLRTKEDYDYTLQHIKRFGGALRCNTILATFEHYTNKGGVVEYRTPEVEQASIKRLKEKWGKIIQDNPKRPNEILIKMPRIKS